MKHAVIEEPIDILHKIETIEEDIQDLKLAVLKGLASSPKKPLSLKGLLKGAKISESDIRKAQRALQGKINI